jgi:hypothetical protein
MSEAHIPAALRREVVARARNRCEYCGIPDDATFVSHEVDHVIAERHGGKTVRENLAYSCFRCNRLKGTDLTSIDPQTGKITRLFNPRTDKWNRHFRLGDPESAVIEPISAIGRTTALFLRFNDNEWIALRAELQRQGRYAPPLS